MILIFILIAAVIVAVYGGIGSLMVFLFALVVAGAINYQRNSD